MGVESALRRAGVRATLADREAPLAEAAMREFEITTQARAAAFLAQVLHESGGLRWFEELADGSAYEGRRDLGNVKRGDGRRFKGRGPIQLTGRSNYAWASRELGIDLIANPARAAEHRIGWRIAGLYWQSRGLNGLADQGAFETITRRINGGLNGFADRKRLWAILKRGDCTPGEDRWHGYTDSERRWITEYDALLAAGRNRARRLVLRGVMRRQARAIRAAAKKSGWSETRRERLRSLEARS